MSADPSDASSGGSSAKNSPLPALAASTTLGCARAGAAKEALIAK